jgi:tetratricopeptide (TPR) repeat protein
MRSGMMPNRLCLAKLGAVRRTFFMLRLGSIVPLVLVFAPSVLGGCKKDEPVTQPETAPSATGSPSGKAKLPLRNSMAPVPKIEPQAMKDYRLEVCYFGTLTLRQARDAYLASLGKDEPSEKKIPNFGMPAALPPTSMIPPVTAPGAGSAGPTPGASARPATPVAIPATSGSAALGRRMADMGLRAPHERNARACTVAAGLKEPAMPDVDAALKDFAPFALELSRNIAAASVYYQREEFAKDKFEKGKELHKKLVADFAKLDELSDKLAVAINAHREKNPVDTSKLDEGEKAVVQAYGDARGIIGLLLAKKIDTAAYKAAIANIEKSVEAVKAISTKNTNDTWTKITTPSLEAFLKGARDAESKITDKGIPSDAFLQLVNTFTAVIEGKHRALSRSLIAKGQTIDPRGGPGGNGRIPLPGVHPDFP